MRTPVSSLLPGRSKGTFKILHLPQTFFAEWLLHFSVRDTGMGIPLDKQHRLFKSFQQVDASTTRQFGGTGLGLAICKRLTEMMGGAIWVDSDAGQGATFHFTVRAQVAASSTPPHWHSVQSQFAGRRVLVVEDSATNRQIMGHRLKQWGLVPEMASTAGEALALLAGHAPYDAAILDLQLPNMDGLALAEKIRQLPRGAAPCVSPPAFLRAPAR